MKYNTYIIPGFAADERMFRSLKVENSQTVCLNWENPQGARSFKEYAQNILLPKIDQSKPIVLVGFSMGGMVASELAKIINPYKLVFIASAKNRKELPVGKVQLLKILRPHKYMTQKRLAKLVKLAGPIFKFASKEHKQLFLAMVSDLPDGFIEFGLASFITWKKEDLPERDYIHIHGEDDSLILHKRVANKQLVPGGHYLMKTRSVPKINEIINEYVAQ